MIFKVMDLTYGTGKRLYDFEDYEEAKRFAKKNLHNHAIKEMEV